MANDLQSSISDYQQILIELLFTDLDLAFTFLDTARVSSWPETQRRNVEHAVKAHKEVSAKALQFEMPDSARKELDAGLRSLKERISRFGVKL